MSVFSVPVTIGVDEEKIAKGIEEEVSQKVLDNITNEIKKVILGTDYFGRIDERNHDPLIRIVERETNSILKNHESEIVELAAKYLAEKMARTKIVKEATKAVVEEVTK